MFTNHSNTNVLRSLVAIVGAALLTGTIFAGTIGPDPRAESFYADTPTVSAPASNIA
ncbi:MAG: hypothetical protein WA906_11805 [Pacificimonas sp.]